MIFYKTMIADLKDICNKYFSFLQKKFEFQDFSFEIASGRFDERQIAITKNKTTVVKIEYEFFDFDFSVKIAQLEDGNIPKEPIFYQPHEYSLFNIALLVSSAEQKKNRSTL